MRVHINPFRNQITVSDDTIRLTTDRLAGHIVAQMQGKTATQQEDIIENLLKFMDTRLLAALDLAYRMAPTPDKDAEEK